jgi:hypothetical protein
MWAGGYVTKKLKHQKRVLVNKQVGILSAHGKWLNRKQTGRRFNERMKKESTKNLEV